MSHVRTSRKLILKAGLLAGFGLAALGAGPALAAGSTITGTVTTAGTTASIADVQVELLTATLAPVNVTAVTPKNATAPESFSIANVPAGTYYLYFYDTAAGDNDAPSFYGGTSLAVATPVHVDGSDPVTLGTTTLPAGGVIAGRVGTTAGGAAIGAGTVAVYAEPGLEKVLTQSNSAAVQSNGTFSLGGLPSGSYLVEYLGNGAAAPYYGDAFYGGASLGLALEEGTPVAVTAGQTSATNFSMPAAGSITGTVTATPSNTLLSGISISAYDPQGNVVESTTTADGAYALNGLLDGNYQIEAEPFANSVGATPAGDVSPYAFQFYTAAATLAAATPVTVSGTGAMADINLALAPAGSIAGTVVNARGAAPVSGLAVSLLDGSGDLLDSAVTEPGGTYTLTNVPAGKFYVRFGGLTYLQRLGTFTPLSYENEYYGGTPALAGAKAVRVGRGKAVTGINGAVLPSSSARRGAPTVSKPVLGGLAKHRVALGFTLAAGVGASADLASLKLKLPAGLSWNPRSLARDLSLGGAKFTRTLKGKTLTLSFAANERGFTLTLAAGGLSDSRKLGLEARAHRLASETLHLTVIDSQGVSTALTARVKRPS